MQHVAGQLARAARKFPGLHKISLAEVSFFGSRRPPRPSPVLTPPAPRPTDPGWSAFENLASRGAGRTATRIKSEPLNGPIDVVIPVYRSLDDTLACIHSVLASPVNHAFELVVIDDCSPEPELSNALQRLADLDLITLLINDHNHGFVGSANRGMRCHPHRDVLLLNSDTVVYGNWLDRLAQHAATNQISSITPLSNNATICSYPVFVHDNPAALEIDFAELDQLAATHLTGEAIEIPTGVGFCMFIPRKALDRFGYFDEAAYGRGYGEENDYCMRAAIAGWRNLLALDVFVRHSGETSFADDAKSAQKAGLNTLTARYPEYLGLVHKHIAADPAAGARQRLDLARLKQQIGDGPITLCLAHTWGGGIQRFINDKADRLRSSGRGILVLTPPPPDGKGHGIAFNCAPPINLPNLIQFGAELLDEDVLNLLEEFDIDTIEIHSLVRWSPKTLAAIPELAHRLSAPYTYYVHDYMAVCPQLNLTDASDRYCGEEGIEQCRKCLRTRKEPSRRIHRGPGFGPLRHFGQTDISAWRAAYHDLLRDAAAIIAPSNDTADRISRYFPDLSVIVEPHEEPSYEGGSLAVPHTGNEQLRIAIIGAIGESKGSGVIVDLARDALARRLPLQFVLIGYTNRTAEMDKLSNITITGQYADSEVYDVIREQRCHIALLPSVWPETYSYTFSIVTAAGLPTVIFDLGAPAERAADRTKVKKLPLQLIRNPADINQAIINYMKSI